MFYNGDGFSVIVGLTHNVPKQSFIDTFWYIQLSSVPHSLYSSPLMVMNSVENAPLW